MACKSGFYMGRANDSSMVSRRTFALSLAAACAGAAGCSSGGTDSGGSAGSAETTEEETVIAGTVEHELAAVICTTDYSDTDYDTTVAWISSSVYDVDAQMAVFEGLEAQKSGQTLEAPLVVHNPFGTNVQSLYVYFTTDEPATVSYTVSVSDDEAATIEDETFTVGTIADFVRDVSDGESATEFEFGLLGLVPNVENTVSITAAYEDGSTETTTFACDMCDVLGDEELQLVVEDGESEAELESGLYAILGNESSDDVDFVFFYDNQGILRGEMPIPGGRVHRLIFQDDLMYFSCTNAQFAVMNQIGQVVQTYEIDGGETVYHMHHDYTTDGENHLIVLANDVAADTVEDIILFLNTDTGEIDNVIDMGDVMPAYKEQALAYHYANTEDEAGGFDGESGVDWLHINTVQWMGDDAVLLSSRETSTIIKLADVYGTPALEYFISSADYWAGTEYEDLVLKQASDFTVQGGQHTITYVEDDSLDDGQYYLYMFNNNIGISAQTTSDFDYTSIGLTNTTETSDEEGAYSYYYKYLVDEDAGTFDLVKSIAVPYSGYNSSAQEVGDNVVTDSGMLGVFGEYDADGALIRQFTMDIEWLLYRVFKYDL